MLELTKIGVTERPALSHYDCYEFTLPRCQ